MRNAERNAAYNPDWQGLSVCVQKGARVTHKGKDGVHLFQDISLPLPVDDFGPFPVVVLPYRFGAGNGLICVATVKRAALAHKLRTSAYWYGPSIVLG